MTTQTVQVEVPLLAQMADLICDMDSRVTPPTEEQIEKAHSLVIKMMGAYSVFHYAPSDGS